MLSHVICSEVSSLHKMSKFYPRIYTGMAIFQTDMKEEKKCINWQKFYGDLIQFFYTYNFLNICNNYNCCDKQFNCEQKWLNEGKTIYIYTLLTIIFIHAHKYFVTFQIFLLLQYYNGNLVSIITSFAVYNLDIECKSLQFHHSIFYSIITH